MLGAVIKVLFFVVVFVYAALFIMWNQGVFVDLVDLTLWPWPPKAFYALGVQIGLLPLVGVVVGAVFMAVAAWGAWANQRAATAVASAQVARAKEKLRSMASTIKTQKAELNELRATEATSASHRTVPQPEPELDSEDDEEII